MKTGSSLKTAVQLLADKGDRHDRESFVFNFRFTVLLSKFTSSADNYQPRKLLHSFSWYCSTHSWHATLVE